MVSSVSGELRRCVHRENEPGGASLITSTRKRGSYDFGKLVVRAALKFAAGFRFSNASPLFEEERHSGMAALIAERQDPIALHRPSACSAFATDYYPVNVSKVYLAEVFKQWFN